MILLKRISKKIPIRYQGDSMIYSTFTMYTLMEFKGKYVYTNSFSLYTVIPLFKNLYYNL